MRSKPVLRKIRNVLVTDGPEKYSALNSNWHQLCIDDGHETPPPFYTFRRGSSNAMNGMIYYSYYPRLHCR